MIEKSSYSKDCRVCQTEKDILKAKVAAANKILDALEVEMHPKNYNLAYLHLREVLK